MIAYSSVAQIGYIYMGIGLGTQAGMVAAVFHVFTHSITKALLFISAVGLYEVSGDKKDYHSLRGAGYRARLAGIGFSVGALSMVGFPMLSGFISKLLFATSALQTPGKRSHPDCPGGEHDAERDLFPADGDHPCIPSGKTDGKDRADRSRRGGWNGKAERSVRTLALRPAPACAAPGTCGWQCCA